VVDGSGLENRHTRKGIGGSNPSLSAIVWHLQVGDTYTDTDSSEGALMTNREVNLTKRVQTPA
jgi:hypothetical protein